jgi:hypothetical protein
MIKILFKIIHYEPTLDHKSNVERTFGLINVIIVLLPIGFLYLIYKDMSVKGLYTDLVFLAIEAATAGLIYFPIKKASKPYVETNVGFEYYNFGKYNTILKTLAFLLLVGFIILIGRLLDFGLHANQS